MGEIMRDRIDTSPRSGVPDHDDALPALGTGPLPSIFVIGFPKAATTSLHRRLVEAGAVGPTVKEPSVLLLDGARLGPLTDAYERYYPRLDGRPAIDSSPYYVYDERAVERIVTLGSAHHVLISVREPWDRIVSQYLDQFRQGLEHRSLAQALGDELDEVPGVVDRSSRSLNRRYVATTSYGPYVERVLASELGAVTRLIAAETLDHPHTREELARWTRLPVGAATDRSNPAATRTSATPALVYGAAARVGAAMPGWAHRRIAPAAKPVMRRLAAIPLPSRRSPDLRVEPAMQAEVRHRVDLALGRLRALPGASWIGPTPDWLMP